MVRASEDAAGLPPPAPQWNCPRQSAFPKPHFWNKEEFLALAEAIQPGELYALSRWNPVTGRISGSSLAADGSVCIPLSIGADAWIFRAPLSLPRSLAPSLHLSAPFPQGKPFCDHRLARLALDAGLRVTNPCLSIRAWHHHASGHRTYTAADSIPGPYAWLPPCTLPAAAAAPPVPPLCTAPA